MVPRVYADEFTKLTYVTFSAPVQVPGVTLPAGTYRFELADPATGRQVLRISNKEGTKPYALLLTIPMELRTPSDDVVVMFKEAPVGMSPAVRAWFYPQERSGQEFVYPRHQALEIAKATHQPVLATSAKGSDVNELRSAKVERVDENDQAVSVGKADANQNPATNDLPVATSGASTDSQANTPAATGRANTSRQAEIPPAPQRRTLPRTASSLGLFELMSVLAFSGAVVARFLRRYSY
jgi:hypothetical protein